MQSRAAIAGHPLHPIFVTIPIGLWSFVPVCDIVFLLGWGEASWKAAALYCVAGGLAGAIPAIATGLLDFPLASGPKARLTVQFHLAINSLCTLLFATSLWLRYGEFHAANGGPDFGLAPVILTFVGAFLLGISGWLGGELVSRFGISVHTDATGPQR